MLSCPSLIDNIIANKQQRVVMYRTPQLTMKTPLSTAYNRHTPSNFSNISETEPQRRLDELTHERQELRMKIAQQKQRNDQLRREIQSDYVEYTQKIEKSNMEVKMLKLKYEEYEREIEEMGKKVDQLGL